MSRSRPASNPLSYHKPTGQYYVTREKRRVYLGCDRDEALLRRAVGEASISSSGFERNHAAWALLALGIRPPEGARAYPDALLRHLLFWKEIRRITAPPAEPRPSQASGDASKAAETGETDLPRISVATRMRVRPVNRTNAVNNLTSSVFFWGQAVSSGGDVG